jgi:hypothetical protein
MLPKTDLLIGLFCESKHIASPMRRAQEFGRICAVYDLSRVSFNALALTAGI